MRVLVISSAYASGGGARRTVWELTRALSRAGVRVTTFVRARQPGDPPHVRGLQSGPERWLDRAARRLGVAPPVWHVGSILRLGRVRAGDFDVVHLHALHGTPGWISLEAVQRLAHRIPTVWTLHDEWALLPGLPVDLQRVLAPDQVRRTLGADLPAYRDHPGVQRARRRLLRRLPRPAAIICPSKHLAELATGAAHLHDVPCHLVPHGLPFLGVPETRMSRSEARRALGLPAGAPIVLVVAARLDHWFKGMPLAGAALGRLRTPDVMVVAAGRASAAIAARLPRSTAYLGYLHDDGALARAYRAADVTLLPSLGENFPYVALESLACGTPVAAFGVGGLPEIVGDGERGILARPFDPAGLAAGLDALLQDGGRRAACGARGRRWVEEVCDVERWLRAHLAIYREAMAGVGPGPAAPARPARLAGRR